MNLSPTHGETVGEVTPRPERLSASSLSQRPVVRGKFLYVGKEKFWVKGATYGTFRPNSDGDQFPDAVIVEKDFAAMAQNGFNAVRTYTVPPLWLLDLAQKHGLRVMVGLQWEQHITFLDNRKRARAIRNQVKKYIQGITGHSALLCYVIGNEIPAPIVRWHGRKQIQNFLNQLYLIVKKEDPSALITYVNFPTTEYLQLPFIDLVCFNVYLESQSQLQCYLARLHNLADDRPLLMAEIGLDSNRNGEDVQATVLNWQLRTLFEAGCSGGFVFAWTDEWYRGGFDIEDWDFGITTRSRSSKPALEAVRSALAAAPFSTSYEWPKISVVVCSYNGAATIQDTLEGIQHLTYPNYEAIVINDGSADKTPDIAAKYPVKLISTDNRGLSSARNTGYENATGEIVAYIDDDAYPDPQWLHYLAAAFLSDDYVGVGGPNLAPPGDGPIADCVANAPGGPVHVLISDQVAEHIPGCNMAFRRKDLIAIGGFDPRYRAAGDDVDLCWRLQDRGGVIGFAPAAVVWHHRRNSIRMYWRQQQGYGKAEALLEEKWPHRYNAAGHLTWTGRLYGKGLTQALPGGKWRIYQGSWGTALFQSIYEPVVGTFRSLPLMPEWYLVIAGIALLSLFGLAWQPLLSMIPLLAIAVLTMIAQAVLSGIKAKFPSQWSKRRQRFALHGITSVLHLVQPLARLIGRLRHGLTPWRERAAHKRLILWPQSTVLWSEYWRPADEWLRTLEIKLGEKKVPAVAGGNFDLWDLWVRGGLLGSAHLLMAIEEHGAGKQLLRFRIWPRCNLPGFALILFLAALAVTAVLDRSQLAAALLGGLSLALAGRGVRECSSSANALLEAQKELDLSPRGDD